MNILKIFNKKEVKKEQISIEYDDIMRYFYDLTPLKKTAFCRNAKCLQFLEERSFFDNY